METLRLGRNVALRRERAPAPGLLLVEGPAEPTANAKNDEGD